MTSNEQPPALVDQDASTYAAYDYLGDDPGLSTIALAPEFNRVPPYDGKLSVEEQKRAERLLDESLVISFHDHPVRFPLQ
ncbi:MAG: hypothetical protein ACP5O0_08960, partial [Acidimicrobiales bacterium]